MNPVQEFGIQLFEVMSIKNQTTGELEVQAYPIHAEDKDCVPDSPAEFLDALDWVIVEHEPASTTLFTMPLILDLPATRMQVSVHLEAEISGKNWFTPEEKEYLTKRYERVTVEKKDTVQA